MSNKNGYGQVYCNKEFFKKFESDLNFFFLLPLDAKVFFIVIVLQRFFDFGSRGNMKKSCNVIILDTVSPCRVRKSVPKSRVVLRLTI